MSSNYIDQTIYDCIESRRGAPGFGPSKHPSFFSQAAKPPAFCTLRADGDPVPCATTIARSPLSSKPTGHARRTPKSASAPRLEMPGSQSILSCRRALFCLALRIYASARYNTLYFCTRRTGDKIRKFASRAALRVDRGPLSGFCSASTSGEIVRLAARFRPTQSHQTRVPGSTPVFAVSAVRKAFSSSERADSR